MTKISAAIKPERSILGWAKPQIFAGVLLAGASTGHAGPDATTNYLMNTPATLMDFGLYKLTSHIRSLLGKGFAVYDWDTNEIRILTFELLTPEDQAKQVCEDVISDIRIAANVRDGTTVNETSSFSDLFSHEGFVKGGKEQHTERMMDLDKKFRIVCITPLETYEAPVVGTGYSLRVRSD
ncbi:hypothetical protein K3758_01110 [Sulfitobacter sp. W002]|uniref:hypothetical protein n=1 Tax=Sulfitobacter sp. W002 TaxID=2867024 RepID=UPI0021A94120|nr:hypothetical protein [Sulfitobacter sp. W002]UWR30174.1 hypothetical protein K3758_01110 [Sulfitobacter sp. W002]